MAPGPSPHFAEMQLALGQAQSEVVRAFVREAALAEGVPPLVAGLLAADTVEAWLALCRPEAGRERAHVALACSHRDVRSRILLQGHSRFSSIVASLAARLRPEAGLSCRERGVDGWEVALRRSLTERAEPAPVHDEAPAPAAAPSTETFDIGPPRQSDTAAIARCFLEVYGRNYVHREVFSPRRYWSKVESGELIPMTARDRNGEVVGHVALEREPGALVAERGEAVVLPACRGRRLLERMTGRLTEEAQRLGLVGIFAQPLTIHVFSQRNDERAGMPACALLLGAAPENFRPRGLPAPTAGQRQSLLQTFRFLSPPGDRRVHAPEPYREILSAIYRSLGVTPSFPERAAPRADGSRTTIGIDDGGYATIRFEEIGRNAAVELEQALRDVRSLGARAVQLSAHVDDPGLPALVDGARRLGFFFCGLGPAFSQGRDILMLQSLGEPLDIGKLQLLTDQAKDLAAFVARDRDSVAPTAP